MIINKAKGKEFYESVGHSAFNRELIFNSYLIRERMTSIMIYKSREKLYSSAHYNYHEELLSYVSHHQ